MDGRRLTFIVVPHGDLETRTYEISYRRLKLILWGGLGLLAVFMVLLSMWWVVASQAARVPGLERELARLEEEKEQVTELARMLAEVEAQYERVRVLLGADAAPGGTEPLLPPLRLDRGNDNPAGTGSSEPAREQSAPGREGARQGESVSENGEFAVSWPLTQLGYVARESAGGRSRRPALEIAVPRDSYIRAAQAGRVAQAGTDPAYGQHILLDHGAGLQTFYGNASRLFVVPGEMVEQHQVIALSGTSGRSGTSQLYFEVRRGDQPVDPWRFVQRP
jgi:murein DD-endopeptidase MepM/ murein hydrolase activator NlpD